MVNNTDAYIAGIWNYDFINEKLPGNLAVSDIDGAIERCGNFLFIEFKSIGTNIPTGQYRMYEQLVQTGLASVLFVFGDTNDPIYYQRMSYKMEGVVLSQKKGTNVEHLSNLVKSWYNWANKNPTVFFKKSRIING